MKNKLIKIGSIIAVVIVLVTMTVVPTFAATIDSQSSLDTMILKAGTYKFNDVLTELYPLEQSINFTFTFEGETTDYVGIELSLLEDAYFCLGLKLGVSTERVYFNPVPTGHEDLYPNGWIGGMAFEITIPVDTEVDDTFGTWFISNTNYNEVNGVPAPDVPDSYFTFYFAAELNTGDSAQIVGADGVVKTINGGKGSGDAIYTITDNPLSSNYVKPRVSSDGQRYVIVSLQLDNYGFDGNAKRYYSLDSSLNGQPIETVSLQSSSYDLNCETGQYWRINGGSGNGSAAVSIDLYIWLGNVVPDPDDSQYQLGYANGYHNGHIDGFTNGYSSGYDEGYMLGYAEGSNQENFIVSIFSDPIGALMGITLYEYDGFELTIGSIFFTIIGILLLVAFLRYFAGG